MIGFLVHGGNYLIARRPLPDRVTATFLVVLTSCSDRSLLVSQSICSMLAASCSLADVPGWWMNLVRCVFQNPKRTAAAKTIDSKPFVIRCVARSSAKH